ncbi:hypothetical protein M0812_26623 [Anaeramoeba flamelloides]|uniref:Dystroglycan-type cadherin-like domain-containing protein n=1 Tax=Anaeramoeba flamelloides TaxID=1746091 RepID=A0AAV7YEN7_9EUKA|nr:hypothetical protein M0812_26623 [Anaeramoeba flamelloides]
MKNLIICLIIFLQFILFQKYNCSETCPIGIGDDLLVSSTDSVLPEKPSLLELTSNKISLLYLSETEENRFRKLYQVMLDSNGTVVSKTTKINDLLSHEDKNFNHFHLESTQRYGVTWQSESKGQLSSRIYVKLFEESGESYTSEIAVNQQKQTKEDFSEVCPTTVVSSDSKKIAVAWVEKNLTTNYGQIKFQILDSKDGSIQFQNPKTLSTQDQCIYSFTNSIPLSTKVIAIAWVKRCVKDNNNKKKNNKYNPDLTTTTTTTTTTTELKTFIIGWDGKKIFEKSFATNEIDPYFQPQLTANYEKELILVVWNTLIMKSDPYIQISRDVYYSSLKFDGTIVKDATLINKADSNLHYSPNNNANDHDLYGIIYGTDLSPIGDVFKINQNNNVQQTQPSILDSGYSVEVNKEKYPEFLVTWISGSKDASSNGIFSRMFIGNSNPISDELKINTKTELKQFSPVLTLNKKKANSVLIAWKSRSETKKENTIFAKQIQYRRIQVKKSIKDQTINTLKFWDFSLEPDLFNTNKQNLDVTATLSDNKALPSWLSFDQADWRIYGKSPEKAASYTILITAEDPCRNNAQIQFNLKIEDVSTFRFNWTLFSIISIPVIVVLVFLIYIYRRKKKLSKKSAYKKLDQNYTNENDLEFSTENNSLEDDFNENEDNIL